MIATHESIQAPQILKADQRGRVRTPAKRREAILAEFEGSALSAQAFAKQLGIKPSTFASWLQRSRGRDQRDRRHPPRAVTFLEAEVTGAAPSAAAGSIEVESPEGFKVRLNQREQIALAVECLQALGGSR